MYAQHGAQPGRSKCRLWYLLACSLAPVSSTLGRKNMDAYIDIEKLITAIAVAVPTAWLTAYFAIKKYRTEKWWDRKLTSYLDTIAALNDLILYCDSVIDVAYEEIDYSDDQIKSFERKFHDARLHIQAQAMIGRILYGTNTYQALLELNNKMFSAERNSNVALRAAEIRELAEECLGIVANNAKKDLGI